MWTCNYIVIVCVWMMKEIYGQEFAIEIFGVNVVYPIKNKQNHASIENKHCLNIKMGSSLSPYAKKNWI